MAKISVSVPDSLFRDVEAACDGHVEAFVETALRHELDRLHLDSLMEQLEDEDSPVDEAEVAKFITKLANVDKANKSARAREGRDS